MNQLRLGLGVAIVFGALFCLPMGLLAAEHGGKEHGGEQPSGQEHGGEEHAGGALAPATDEAATLNEAADALDVTDPVLADELRAWAEGTGPGDKSASLNQAADALEGTNPDLAARLKALAG